MSANDQQHPGQHDPADRPATPTHAAGAGTPTVDAYATGEPNASREEYPESEGPAPQSDRAPQGGADLPRGTDQR